MPDPTKAATISDPGTVASQLQAATAGRYELQGHLGQGGMGIVYLARDLSLDRRVAIKVLPPSLSWMPYFHERFLRETRTAASLFHPHIVPVYGVEAHGDLLMLVMGFVDGESLAERIRRAAPLPPTEVARTIREIGWALGYAHGRGIVHRDVKPANILLEHATGRALLVDFGVAHVSDSSLTQPGSTIGTPHYMSPEQAGGTAVDGRSDVYSLGVVAFHALTGRLPFEGTTPQEVLAKHLNSPPLPVNRVRSEVPLRLGELVDRCLAKDPANRWQTADALVAALPVVATNFVEVAPPVRNFHRAAALALHQVVILAVTLLVLGLLQPGEATLYLATLGLATIAILLQLRTRAQLLVVHGYGHEDLRAAAQADLGLRVEEAESLRDALGPRSRPGWLFSASMIIGAALIVAGLLEWPPSPLVRFQVAAGFVILAIAATTRIAGNPARRRGVTSLVNRFWAGKAGRLLFRVLAAGRLPNRASEASDPLSRNSFASVWERLGPKERKTWEAIQQTIRALERKRQDLARQAQAIDEALAPADRASAGPATTLPPEESGRDPLRERRSELVSALKESRERVKLQAERVEVALENLQLQLTRLRSGLVSADEAEPDLRAGRDLLEG